MSNNEPSTDSDLTSQIDNFKSTINSKYRSFLVIVPILIIVFIVFGFIFIQNSKSKTNSGSKPTPTSQINQPENRPRKLTDFAGTIKQIDKEGKVASVEAVLVVRGDNAKEYTVQVNSSTRVNKYSEGKVNNPPKLLTDKESFKVLAVGDRIHVYSYLDISVVTKLFLNDIVALDLNLTTKIK